MPVKIDSRNRVTLPKSVVDALPGTRLFDVQLTEDRIVLTPVPPRRSESVREKLASLGIAEADVAASVKWARKRP